MFLQFEALFEVALPEGFTFKKLFQKIELKKWKKKLIPTKITLNTIIQIKLK